MKFNEDKFKRGTDFRGYDYWDEQLLGVLDKAGNRYPAFNNGAREFLMSATKEGKYKRSKLFHIICPTDGSDIKVELIDNMDKEEVQKAMDIVINFVAVMTARGYITE